MSSGEEQMSMIFRIFSSIAVIVACLDLCGLASYTTALRKKEIGIQKVFGSTVFSVILLLSRNFSCTSRICSGSSGCLLCNEHLADQVCIQN